MAPAWRLLLDGAADGAWNMAVDEALLEACATAAEPGAPTLRLYAWRPPALSLGRGQRAARSHDPDFLRRHGIDLVRRPTGGRAVLHEHERTYAVVGRRGGAFPGGVLETYARISVALREAFGRLGLAAEEAPRGAAPARAPDGPLCFATASAHEILARGRKLAGSAQLRRGPAFLQHGSLLLRADAARLGSAAGTAADPGRLIDLEQALGRSVETGELDRALVGAFEDVFEVRLEPGDLTAEERLLATRLRAGKYLTASWTLEGRARTA